MLKLIGFRVLNFRSVEDSGWIEVDDVASLIGTNESGKTNLLLPLWKFNPAKNGEISPTADFPRKRYNEIRSMNPKPVFIQAQFEVPDNLAQQIVDKTGATLDQVKIVTVGKNFDDEYHVDFPNVVPLRQVAKDDVAGLLTDAHKVISGLESAGKTEECFSASVLQALADATDVVEGAEDLIDAPVLSRVISTLESVEGDPKLKRSTISPRFGQVVDDLKDLLSSIRKPHPNDSEFANDKILGSLPVFVYYSNYGNLDSEIYLPHVIENIRRTDLGNREEAKARTLKVLFEFVKLNPQEILDLGQEIVPESGRPTDREIKAIAEKKKERDILLQSAGTELTAKFRSWWQQGEYRFRFQADGNHFRIWVSDDKRPEEIELEGRSTGLQWFLSFYLIFLVESLHSHANAILLLDEPGMSLHPIAQKDLSLFFSNLCRTNQLIYTTHSPFLVDPDHLDRIKAVYVNDDGTTGVSSNLRAGEKNPAQTRSIYPVHAALGLTVSEILFQGCQAVVVEGASDQHYLSAIKTYLIGKGLIMPKREILFVPSGGVKGVSAIVSLLTATSDALPYVILDSDAPGQNMSKSLKSNLYSGFNDRIIMIEDVQGLSNSEVEDLFPPHYLAKIVARKYFRDVDKDFEDTVRSDEAFVPQVQKFAQENDVVLEMGWKVELAMQAKKRFLQDDNSPSFDDRVIERWTKLFDKLQSH
jgi:predicted ATP-dependent endonuclease of OLD family